jgi:hypothetical protein
MPLSWSVFARVSTTWSQFPAMPEAVVCEQIICPNLERINRTLGQENDPMHLAYAVEYVLGLALHK